MTVQAQIEAYIADQDPSKREALQALQRLVLKSSPGCKLWFLDGRNSEGKVVSNENIGFGAQVLRYADGAAREFYRIGLSANSAGVSLYLIGLDDKTYLPETYGKRLPKAKITGYCVRFRRIEDVDVDILEEMIVDHMAGRSVSGA